MVYFPPGGGGKAPLPICKQLAQSREMRSECASKYEETGFGLKSPKGKRKKGKQKGQKGQSLLKAERSLEGYRC